MANFENVLHDTENGTLLRLLSILSSILDAHFTPHIIELVSVAAPEDRDQGEWGQPAAEQDDIDPTIQKAADW